MDKKDLLIPPDSLDYDVDGGNTSFRLMLAVAVVLSEMAHTDDQLDRSEFETIIRILDHQFEMMDEQAEYLREVAEILIQDKSKVDEAIDTMNKHFAKEQKQRVFDLAWSVATADGVLDKHEVFFANYLKARFGLE